MLFSWINQSIFYGQQNFFCENVYWAYNFICLPGEFPVSRVSKKKGAQRWRSKTSQPGMPLIFRVKSPDWEWRDLSPLIKSLNWSCAWVITWTTIIHGCNFCTVLYRVNFSSSLFNIQRSVFSSCWCTNKQIISFCKLLARQSNGRTFDPS